MRIKYFNRYELKYVIHRDVADKIADGLLDYLEPDTFGGVSGNYTVTSLYFDSPDYRAYWDKLEGHKYRRKVRLRVYGNQVITPDTECFVEIKERNNRSLAKRRIIVPYSSALVLCQDSKPYDLPTETDQATMREVQYLSTAFNLQAACIVSYNRLAFNGHEYDTGLRVTFDTDLKGRAHALSLLSDREAENHFFLPPQWCIMEVKVNNRVPYWLTEFFAQYRCVLQRVSKYCSALETSKVLLQHQRISN